MVISTLLPISRALRCLVASAAFLGCSLIGAAALETESQLRACWAADGLRTKSGEELIKRSDAIAATPTGSAVSFSPIPAKQLGAIRRVELPEGIKLVALTFDLCEQADEVAGFQGDMVDYLRAHGVKATFFAGGKWMVSHHDRAQQLMFDPLFELANHTWEHRNLRLLDGPALADEIRSPQLAYEQLRSDLVTQQCLARDGRALDDTRPPARLSLFRFPFGACDEESLLAVAENGLVAIQWDVNSEDPSRRKTPDQITSSVLSNVRPGSIVLFHANGRGWTTANTIPDIVTALKADGYEFVTVSELLRAGTPIYASTCYNHVPGDTDRYDRLARRLDARAKARMISEPSE
jgi:peptidoglycan/xylan/chitin deacetylase (PgdA/CDA1 family)